MRIDLGYQIPDAKVGLACGDARRRIQDGGALTGPVQVAKKEYTYCIQEYTVNYILSQIETLNIGASIQYRARKQAVDLLDGRLLTRAVAVPISRALI